MFTRNVASPIHSGEKPMIPQPAVAVLILMSSIAQARNYDLGTEEGLRAFQKDHSIHSPDEFIAHLPEDFLSNWTFAVQSDSVQASYLPGSVGSDGRLLNKVGIVTPRVLLNGASKSGRKVIISFSTDQLGSFKDGIDRNLNHFHNIEVSTRSGKDQNPIYRDVAFENGLLKIKTSRSDTQEDAARCMSCHNGRHLDAV